MKHEPDCGCLTCYQALRKFRDRCKGLVVYWRSVADGSDDSARQAGFALFATAAMNQCAERLAGIIEESEADVS